MAPKLIHVIWLGDIHGPKPNEFIYFGVIHGPKHQKSRWLVDIHGAEPFKLKWLGDIHGPKTSAQVRNMVRSGIIGKSNRLAGFTEIYENQHRTFEKPNNL